MSNKKTYIIFYLVIKSIVYIDIKDYSNVLEIWYPLKQNSKLYRSSFLNGTMKKLFFLILYEYKYAIDYFIKFYTIITKLKSFF